MKILAYSSEKECVVEDYSVKIPLESQLVFPSFLDGRKLCAEPHLFRRDPH